MAISARLDRKVGEPPWGGQEYLFRCRILVDGEEVANSGIWNSFPKDALDEAFSNWARQLQDQATIGLNYDHEDMRRSSQRGWIPKDQQKYSYGSAGHDKPNVYPRGPKAVA